MKLTKPEGALLSLWKKEGLSNIERSKKLGRNNSTIRKSLSSEIIKYITTKKHLQKSSLSIYVGTTTRDYMPPINFIETYRSKSA